MRDRQRSTPRNPGPRGSQPRALQRERMSQRGGSRHDVVHALAHGTSCRLSGDAGAAGQDRWIVDGKDVDGWDLTVVAEIDNGVIVITMF